MVRTRPLTARLVTPVVMVLLLLSGCAQDEPEPKFAEEPSATPTVEDEETAEEFIRRWNDAYNRAMTGDTEEFRKLSPDCEPCTATAEQVERYFADGGFVDAGIREVVRIGKSQRFKDRQHAFTATFKSPPTTYAVSAGADEQSFPGGQYTNEVQLRKAAGDWTVLNYSRSPE